MAKSPQDDFSVMLPLKRLLELTELSKQVPALLEENTKLKKQILALRIIQQECMEKIGELEKLL